LLLVIPAAALRARGATLALLAPATVLAIDLAFVVGGVGRVYDGRATATVLAARDGAIAAIGDYEGEFSFVARLHRPVAIIAAADAEDWLAAHRDGVVLGRLDRRHPAAPPAAVFA